MLDDFFQYATELQQSLEQQGECALCSCLVRVVRGVVRMLLQVHQLQMQVSTAAAPPHSAAAENVLHTLLPITRSAAAVWGLRCSSGHLHLEL